MMRTDFLEKAIGSWVIILECYVHMGGARFHWKPGGIIATVPVLGRSGREPY